MTNPLLSTSEQAYVNTVRSRSASTYQGNMSSALGQINAPDNGLIPVFNVTWGRFLSALIVAFNGGAYVGGNALPVGYELIQGVHTGLPFLFNGLGLVVCGAVAHSLHDPVRNVGFTLAQTLLTSWI